MIPEDRQSHKDCHTGQDKSRRTRGSTSKGYLSKGYCSLTGTLRMMGTPTMAPQVLGESSLLRKILAALYSC
jgi:hypothetical protein